MTRIAALRLAAARLAIDRSNYAPEARGYEAGITEFKVMYDMWKEMDDAINVLFEMIEEEKCKVKSM